MRHRMIVMLCMLFNVTGCVPCYEAGVTLPVWSTKSCPESVDGTDTEPDPGISIDPCQLIAVNLDREDWSYHNDGWSTLDPLPDPGSVISMYPNIETMHATSATGISWNWEWFGASPDIGSLAVMSPWTIQQNAGSIVPIRDDDGYALPQVMIPGMIDPAFHEVIPWIVMSTSDPSSTKLWHHDAKLQSTLEYTSTHVDLTFDPTFPLSLVHTSGGIYTIVDVDDRHTRFWSSSSSYVGVVTEQDPVLAGAVFDDMYPELSFSVDVTHAAGRGFWPMMGFCRMYPPDDPTDGIGGLDD